MKPSTSYQGSVNVNGKRRNVTLSCAECRRQDNYRCTSGYLLNYVFCYRLKLKCVSVTTSSQRPLISTNHSDVPAFFLVPTVSKKVRTWTQIALHPSTDWAFTPGRLWSNLGMFTFTVMSCLTDFFHSEFYRVNASPSFSSRVTSFTLKALMVSLGLSSCDFTIYLHPYRLTYNRQRESVRTMPPYRPILLIYRFSDLFLRILSFCTRKSTHYQPVYGNLKTLLKTHIQNYRLNHTLCWRMNYEPWRSLWKRGTRWSSLFRRLLPAPAQRTRWPRTIQTLLTHMRLLTLLDLC